MKTGLIGLGKLGTPVAVAMDYIGHDVMGFDINPETMSKENFKHLEKGPDLKDDFTDYLEKSNVKFAESITDIVRHAEIVFVAVQTPHDPLYEGITRVPETRKDFNYDYLVAAVDTLAQEIEKQKKKITVVVISTVLPGTMRERIIPLLNEYISFVYNPYFIAMNSVFNDFLYPEFILLGLQNQDSVSIMKEFYSKIDAPLKPLTVEEAEFAKVAYNTFIGMKITFANTVMEVCHRMNCGMNSEKIMNVLTEAKVRLISTKYLQPGMGDSGGCHPRDGIALSWMSQKLGINYDIFGHVMAVRERQAEYICDLAIQKIMPDYRDGVFVLGTAYKKNVNIETGSCGLLCYNILHEKGVRVYKYDPYVNGRRATFPRLVYIVGVDHDLFRTFEFPLGSAVIDPWNIVPQQNGVEIVRVGRGY